MKFRKKPVVIEAVQWFKMGDHPAVICADNAPTMQTITADPVSYTHLTLPTNREV